MKKVLIITAEKTGTGHKSSSNAIEMKLKPLGYEVKQIDAFPFMGKIGEKMEASYIPLTLKHPNLWYTSYLYSQKFTGSLNKWLYLKVKNRMLKEIKEYNPDLIISVHSMFNASITKLIKKFNLNIPFYVVVVDLVKPPRLWFNKYADMTFVPTKPIYDDYINKGMDPAKIIESGFPVRSDIAPRKTPKEITDKINILLVNPSVNLNTNIEFAKEISRVKNANITFICGRDEILLQTLKEKIENGELSKDIQVHGFVTNMNEFLDISHILLTKART